MTATEKAQFVLERCPHCGSDAQVEPQGVYRFKCRACGRPRIPMDARTPTSAEAAAQLKSAHSSRMARGAFTVAGYVLLFLAFCSTLVTLGLVISSAGPIVYGIMGAITLLPVLLSIFIFSKAKTAAERSTAALERAWADAVTAIYRSRGGQLTAQDLASTTGLSVDEATERLAEAEVAEYLNPDLSSTPRFRVPEAESAESPEAQAEQELREVLGEAQTETFKARS